MSTVDTSPAEADVALDIVRLSGTIGAEIRGIDLRQPLDEPTTRAVRQALLDYKVIFFPGQCLSPAQHVAFGRQFGQLTSAHPVAPGIAGYPEIFEIDYTRARQMAEAARQGATSLDDSRRRDEGWHTDVTYMPTPPLGSILNAVVMPDYGGDTVFADTQAAYEGLSASMRRLVDDLVAVHDGESTLGNVLRLVGEGEWDGERFTELTPTEHPVVRTHPETGRRSLFVNPGFTAYLKGFSARESQGLLDILYRHMIDQEYLVRYRWHVGDLGFWDNRTTMHYAVNDYGTAHRVIQRVTLRGDRPV